MFRLSLGHLQDLKEHRSKILYFSYKLIVGSQMLTKMLQKFCNTLKYMCVWILCNSCTRALPQFIPTYDISRQHIPGHSPLPTRSMEKSIQENYFPRTRQQPQRMQNRRRLWYKCDRRLFGLKRRVKTSNISNFMRSGVPSYPPCPRKKIAFSSCITKNERNGDYI